MLLYDLAKSLVGELPSCVIHCGQLSEGHRLLNSSQSSFSVVPAKGCEKIALEDYGAIFIDECHRLRLHQFNEVVRRIKETELPCFFFLDSNQTMQASEIRNEISSKIIETMPNAICKELSKKIRTNKRIAAFVRRLFSLKSESNQIRFENIEVLYAGEILEAGTKPTDINISITRLHSTKNGILIFGFTFQKDTVLMMSSGKNSIG